MQPARKVFKNTPLRLNQAGDTLIEVVIATVIIGSVLFSAYSLSTKAFQLSQSARERSQAAQLLQTQAEGLRSQRDQAQNWDSFRSSLQGSVNLAAFHIIKNAGNQWQAISNAADDPDNDELWQPGCLDQNCNNGQDNTVASYYELKITANFSANPSDPTELDLLSATISIEWPRLGGGPTETSQLYIKLTDNTLPLTSFNEVIHHG